MNKMPKKMIGGKYKFSDLLKNSKKKKHKKGGCGLTKKDGKRCNKKGTFHKDKCENIKGKCRKKIKTQKKNKTKKRTISKSRSRLEMNCLCDKKRKFKGNEPSPKGLGHCAHCTEEGTIMKGRDGNWWKNTKYSKGVRWIKMKNIKTGGFIRSGSTMTQFN
jgi:hypothetical protein